MFCVAHMLCVAHMFSRETHSHCTRSRKRSAGEQGCRDAADDGVGGSVDEDDVFGDPAILLPVPSAAEAVVHDLVTKFCVPANKAAEDKSRICCGCRLTTVPVWSCACRASLCGGCLPPVLGAGVADGIAMVCPECHVESTCDINELLPPVGVCSKYCDHAGCDGCVHAFEFWVVDGPLAGTREDVGLRLNELLAIHMQSCAKRPFADTLCSGIVAGDALKHMETCGLCCGGRLKRAASDREETEGATRQAVQDDVLRMTLAATEAQTALSERTSALADACAETERLRKENIDTSEHAHKLLAALRQQYALCQEPSAPMAFGLNAAAIAGVLGDMGYACE
jgi:hypothetical protein